MKTRRWPTLCSLFCALVLRAAPTGASQSAGAAPTGSAAWTELISSMETMHVAMASVGPCGGSDVEFVRLMVPHHQGAIDMAKAELLHGNSKEMRRLAQEIITDQQSEIDLMRLWLKAHDSGCAESKPSPRSSDRHE